MSDLIEVCVRSSGTWELIKLENESPRGEPILLMHPRVGGIDNPEINDPLLIIYGGESIVSKHSSSTYYVGILANEYAFVTKKEGGVCLRGSPPGTTPKITKLFEYDLNEKKLNKEGLGVRKLERNEAANHLFCTPREAYIGRREVIPKLREILDS